MLPLQLLLFHAFKRYISSKLCASGLPSKDAVGAPLMPQFEPLHCTYLSHWVVWTLSVTPFSELSDLYYKQIELNLTPKYNYVCDHHSSSLSTNLCILLCFSSLNQVKIKTLETELREALGSSKSTTLVSEPESAALSDSRPTGDGTVVTKKLEEELKKRDALIEVCYTLQLCLIEAVYQLICPV